MKIEKGMYVRYVSSFNHNDSDKPVVKIGKIIRVDDYIQLDTFWPSNGVFPTEDFKKFIIGEPSFNIMDVIESNDLVNEIWVEENNGRYLETLEHDCEMSSLGHIEYVKIWPRDIYTVLTHEQYDAMKYTIGE